MRMSMMHHSSMLAIHLWPASRLVFCMRHVPRVDSNPHHWQEQECMQQRFLTGPGFIVRCVDHSSDTPGCNMPTSCHVCSTGKVCQC
jgi:hypothetical protein